MYKGELKGFPKEVVDKMLERQYEQTGKKDVSVFERRPNTAKYSGGFDWDETIEDSDFWSNVINREDFPKFYKRYPKQSNQNTMSDLKTLVQKIIALKPEKKEQLEKIFPEELKEPPLNVWPSSNMEKWLIGDNQAASKEANIALERDKNGNTYIFLHKDYDWEIREGNKLYAKYKSCQPPH